MARSRPAAGRRSRCGSAPKHVCVLSPRDGAQVSDPSIEKLRWLVQRLRFVTFGELLWRSQQVVRQAAMHWWGLRLHWVPRSIDLDRCERLVRSLEVVAPAWAIRAEHHTTEPAKESVRPFPRGAPVLRADLLQLTSDAYDMRALAGEFGPWIDWRSDRHGDIREYWERCRLHWLSREVADAPDASALLSGRLREFLEAAPPMEGAAWISGLEGASRGVAVTLAAGVAKSRGVVAAECGQVLLEMLVGCSDLLSLTSSRGSSRNNHSLGERSAQAVLAWVGGAGHEQVVNLAMDAAAEFIEQSYADGSGREIATDYWRYNFEWATLMVALAHAVGLELDESFISRYENAGAVLRRLAARAPGFIVGDTDDAVVWSRFWPLSSRSPLNGESAPDPDVPECTVTTAGLAIVAPAGSKTGLVLRGGRFGFPRMAPHSHADLLSVFLQVDGTPFIIDPGSDRYFGTTQREKLRREAAHATFSVEGLRQGNPSGRFMWTDTKDATLYLHEDSVTASFQTAGALLSRKVRWGGGPNPWFEVSDTVVDSQNQAVEWNWPLGSDISGTLVDHATAQLRREQWLVRLSCEIEPAVPAVLQMVPCLVSPGYAALNHSHALRLTLPSGMSVRWRFEITNDCVRS